MTYEFNDEDEYKGYKFVSIKKVTQIEGGKQKFQNVTVKPQDWPEVRDWLFRCIEECKKTESKEPTPF